MITQTGDNVCAEDDTRQREQPKIVALVATHSLATARAFVSSSTVATTGPASNCSWGSVGAGQCRRRQSGTTGRRDGLRLVRWADHSTKPETDPQVVLGHLPAPRLGASPGRGIGPIRVGHHRAARRGPRPVGAHPP